MSAFDRVVGALSFFRSLSVFKISQDYPKAYLAAVFFSALLGYAYLLLFPFGIIYGGYQSILAMMLPFSGEMLLTTLTWLSITLFCAGITHGILSIRFEKRDGIVLKPEKARLIFNKLEEIQREIRWPQIHEVLLTQRFELNIVKTPIFGLPFWSRNTLLIGYPFMQTLPPEYFDCALTRKLTQFAKRKNILYNWLSFLRDTWLLYPDSFKKRAKIGDQLSYWFFRVYGNFYQHIALYISQADELRADAMVLNKLNDRDVFKTAESIRLIQIFLSEHYWPKLNDLLEKKRLSPEKIRPYDHLSKSTRQMLQSTTVNHWLKMLSLEKTRKGSDDAPFSKRMEYMGYNKTCNPDPGETNAAQHYFGSANSQLIALMNKLWAKQVSREQIQKKSAASNRTIKNNQQRLTVAF